MNPQLFGKYQLVKKLATGGMAEVWLARQKGIEGFAKNVVVKRILPHLAEDREFVEMFRNEALIAARFNHPNIAQVYEFGEANGTYFIAMEYIHGEDLGRVMRKAYNAGGWIARPLAIRIVAAACEGLYYAHTRADDQGKPLRVVHRDISPQNILVSFDGSVKLVDFGIAKAADQASMTKSGAIKGKFAYMAPEQAGGKALDSRADIFAIGLVLYELLTGTRPLKRDMELATLQAALECNIQPPSQVADVPPDLDSVVMKALAKAADDRYRDARQLQLALEEFLVSQRWVAGSVQISELMETLFSDRLDEERQTGNPEPRGEDSMSVMPVPPEPPPEEDEPPPPPPSRSASRVESRASQPPADMNWEAPPGEMQPQRRTGARAAITHKRTESATLPLTSVPEDEEWAAPASTEYAPRRRTGQEPARRATQSGVSGGTATARPPSRVDVSRGETSPPRRTGTESSAVRRGTGTRVAELTVDESSPRNSRASLAAESRSQSYDEDDDPERTMLPPPPEPEPAPPPVRRRTGVSGPQVQADAPVRRRTSSRAEMAESPPPRRRPTSMVHAEDAEDSIPDARAPAAGRALPRLKNLLGVFLALGLVGMAIIFRRPITEMLTSSAADGQGIYLNVSSNQRVQVSVRHSQRCHSSEPITVLGFTPLQHMGGAHVQDTIILENKVQGIYWEENVPFGEPQETKTIEHNFQLGSFRPKVVPRSVMGVEFFLEGQKIGVYQPGLRLDLVEGTHNIVVQGPALREPVAIKVEVKANQIVDQTIDVSKNLLGQ